MADDPLTDCPECKTEVSLRKVLNSVGIVFKGSGFYVTDNRGKKNGATGSANGKAGSNGDSAKSDPAAKTEGSGKAEKKSESSSAKKTAEKTAVSS